VKHFLLSSFAKTVFSQLFQQMTKAESRNADKTVPYFVLHLSDEIVKALFVVESSMTEKLISYPILCRGASFDLAIDAVSKSREKSPSLQNNGTTFLSTEFSSPDPEESARAIAERIAIRQENPTPNFSNMFR